MKLRTFPSAISAAEFLRNAQGWLIDCEIRQVSKNTLANRRLIIDKFAWWVNYAAADEIDTQTLREFLRYIVHGHTTAAGRWGNPANTSEVKPATVAFYHRHLRAYCNWLVAEGVIDASPMERIAAPIDRPDQIQPLERNQVLALLAAARKSQNPRRDEAIVWMLLDTGMRVAELAELRRRDLDMALRTATIEGKGGKRRTVTFGRNTARSLWAYLREDDNDAPEGAQVFVSSRFGDGMRPSSVTHIIHKLGEAAGITSVRVSPHSLRHTFAVLFLRGGGDQYALMTILGHTDVKMTSRYVALTNADVAAQHRKASPADRITRR